jgi:hypothetical protein
MKETVLVPGPDHTYYAAKLKRVKVVVNKYAGYIEYVGDEYLDPYEDDVVEMWVAL